jgi:hypothetical protein
MGPIELLGFLLTKWAVEPFTALALEGFPSLMTTLFNPPTSKIRNNLNFYYYGFKLGNSVSPMLYLYTTPILNLKSQSPRGNTALIAGL